MIKYVGRRGKKQLGFERGLDAQYEVLDFFLTLMGGMQMVIQALRIDMEK